MRHTLGSFVPSALCVLLLATGVPVAAAEGAGGVAIVSESRCSVPAEETAAAAALFEAGACLNGEGFYHLAAETLERAVRLGSGGVETRYELAHAYGKLKCFQDAAEEYRTIADLDPGDLEARFHLSYAYSRLDWHDKAASTFREIVVALCDESLPAGGCAEETVEGIDGLIGSYARHIWNDNGEADRHYQRGLIYLMLARKDLAREEYRALRKSDPYRASGLYRLIRR